MMDGMMDGMMGGIMSGNSMMGMCLMMGIGLFLLIILIGVTIYMVVRQLMKKSSVTDRPLLLLKERYVKGEINEEEYQLKRKVLNEK
ncbi:MULTISPECIES: SHOCT domain-containing protein [Bacillati]|nr:SHOCT domain-containing protein [Niallia taxi]MDK8643000.1 SHOCT domain-containing protein [Niallia taxi]MED4038248.1 SHOCT domain-containing protein [Niallia taxi]MED4055141.1 SHOCT domain-containing protein [Niallia taxi]MED4120669.1 SHOCT domain-containing protein [Niallia taxi]